MHLQYRIAALAIAVALVGCGTQPIHNVTQGAMINAAGKELSREQMRAAILRAGSALGWEMQDEGQDRLVGTLQLRRHTAIVEVPYSASGYSIKYRSSVNLDERNGMIHKNYNGWIQKLHRGINTQMSLS